MRSQPGGTSERRVAQSPGTVLRIGDVVSSTGVSADTLRFYERRGLLRPVGRRASGYREYDDGAVRLVRFIRRAQSLGFTLAEVEELIHLRERAWSGTAPSRLREATDAKMREIDRRIRELGALRGALGKLLKDCDRACAAPRDPRGALDCPLVEALEDASGEGAVQGKKRSPSPGRLVAKRGTSPAAPSTASRRNVR